MMLVSAGCVAIHGATQRYLLREHLIGKRELLAFQAVVAAVLLLPFVGWDEFQTSSVPNERLFWIAVVGLSVANLFIQFANVQARAASDLSLTAPVQGMTPMLVTLGAVVLGEFPGPQGLIGIALIALGTWIHGNEHARSWRDYLRPFSMLWLPRNILELPEQEQIQVKRDVVALRWAYLSACCGTAGLVFDSLVSRSGPIAVGYASYYGAVAVVWCVYAAFSREMSTPFIARVRTRPVLMFSLGASMALGALATAIAFRLAPVAYVGSMKRLAIIMSVLIGWWILRESKAGLRLIPATIIAGGAALLVFDPTSQAVVDAAYEALR